MATVSQFLIILSIFLVYLIAVSIYLLSVKDDDPKRKKANRVMGTIIMVSSVLLLIPVLGNIGVAYNAQFLKSQLGNMLALACG